MKQQPNQINTELLAYNKCVQAAYYKILKLARNQLATIEYEELRYSLTRSDRIIIHEFVTPVVYLRLDCTSYGVYAIHYGFELMQKATELSKLTASFTRAIYRLTSKEITSINIENSVHTDWVIYNPSELYEHVEERNRHHTFALIKHRVTATQRKRMLSVA